VDTKKEGRHKFITEQICLIDEYDEDTWLVIFKRPPHKGYNYDKDRLLYIDNPEYVDFRDKGLYIRDKRVYNATELLRFSYGIHIFYRVTYANGYNEDLDHDQVYITRTPLNKAIGSVFDYLRTVATEVGLKTEDDENILLRQYDMIDKYRDNVPLAQYLGDKTKLSTCRLPEYVYYPFSCNASQKIAVEAALTHQVSIIQGPPGTGKTQTILNIIANLLVAGKNVLVVSNNNSAIENVAEKLDRVGLGFVVAKLGSVKNREEFIANQPSYPNMDGWRIKDEDECLSIKDSVETKLETVSQGFELQLRQAKLRTEYDALLKETRYNDMLELANEDSKWLKSKPSAKLMTLLNLYERKAERENKPCIWFRLKWSFMLDMKMFSLLKRRASEVMSILEKNYYYSRKAELEKELQAIETKLKTMDIKQNIKDLQSLSLRILKNELACKYSSGMREKFTIKNIKPRSDKFLKEYPVVLSTAYSSKSCISKEMVFDYVIIDEASQVDVITGALTLSCAKNAVIVGDDKQLPNIVGREETLAMDAIQKSYNVDDKYNILTHSFLRSCCETFEDAPITLLREHYRCHPKIIEFCNKRFYDGELVAMTIDNQEENVLQIHFTVKGNHARKHVNQREIDVILQEVMPMYDAIDNVGIITPYRSQSAEINRLLGKDIASTVHRYQGKECDTIIMSMVDNKPTAFSDDSNLLNVAISRAKHHLCIVANGNEMPQNTNLAQLIAYVKYNNFNITNSKLHSVFDLLYKQYTVERLAYETSHANVSGYLSENIVFDLLGKAITELGFINTEVLCHYPLSKLIIDWTLLNPREKAFAESPFSHVDFLIYNSLTKQPLLTIEVDGWHYHKDIDVQQKRDILKDQILSKLNLRLYRIVTTEIVDVNKMKQVLSEYIKHPTLHFRV
jgi:superfamily I DNA and/or RNA helicase